MCLTCIFCSVTQRLLLWKAEAHLMWSTALTPGFTQVCLHHDIYEHKSSCVCCSSHHQWIHYEQEQKSYSLLMKKKKKKKKWGGKVDFFGPRRRPDFFFFFFFKEHLEEQRHKARLTLIVSPGHFYTRGWPRTLFTNPVIARLLTSDDHRFPKWHQSPLVVLKKVLKGPQQNMSGFNFTAGHMTFI